MHNEQFNVEYGPNSTKQMTQNTERLLYLLGKMFYLLSRVMFADR